MTIDPLLRFLRLKGSGSWSAYASAVDAFAPDLDARSLARGLAEHALVEFDYERQRWSVAPTAIVAVPQKNGSTAYTAWGGTPRAVSDAGIFFNPSTRTIHTWSGDVEYTDTGRVEKPKNGWPRSWEPTHADIVRARIPRLDAVLRNAPIVESPRLGQPLEFEFRNLKGAGDGKPARWVDADFGERTTIDVSTPTMWKRRQGKYVYPHGGRAAVVDYEVGAWLAFRAWLKSNGVELGIVYDDKQETLYISAAPFLPVPYVRALMLSGARESIYFGNRIRVFHNVDSELRDWLADLVGISF